VAVGLAADERLDVVADNDDGEGEDAEEPAVGHDDAQCAIDRDVSASLPARAAARGRHPGLGRRLPGGGSRT